MREARMLRIPQVSTIVVASVVFLSIEASSQVSSLAPGDIVRTASADSASRNLWVIGRVLSVGSDSVLLTDTDAPPLLRLNESIRLQVNRGRRRQTAIGGVLGVFAGAIAGVLSVSTERATSPADGASLGALFQYGALGAVIGAAVGSRFGPTRWEEVPTGQRAALAASLPVAGVELEDVVNVEWWTRLESERVDVAAILELHAGNLAPIEGIWEQRGETGIVAIVREGKYDGIDYVAYAPSGRIVGAVNGPETDSDTYSVRFPPGTRQYSAGLTDTVLTLRSPGDTVRQWVKRSITVDSNFLALSHGVTLLSPVVVEAPRANERLRDVGFLQRMQSLSGTFLTREDIVRQNPRTTAELLRRIPGFRVSSSGVVSAPRETLCSGVGYYIDGVHADGSEISFVLPNAVAGMEVYNSTAAVPIQYHVAGNPRCGVILIWTVEGGKIP